MLHLLRARSIELDLAAPQKAVLFGSVLAQAALGAEPSRRISTLCSNAVQRSQLGPEALQVYSSLVYASLGPRILTALQEYKSAKWFTSAVCAAILASLTPSNRNHSEKQTGGATAVSSEGNPAVRTP